MRLRPPCDAVVTMASSSSHAFHYILRCADDTLYVGHTEDLASRLRLHNEGRGAAYTAKRTPVDMVYAEEYGSVESAIAREHQLKRWSSKKKEALVRRDRWALSSYAHKPLKSHGAR